MLMLGILLVVVAAILIVFGVVNAAVSALLWIGIAVAVVALVLIVLDRRKVR